MSSQARRSTRRTSGARRRSPTQTRTHRSLTVHPGPALSCAERGSFACPARPPSARAVSPTAAAALTPPICPRRRSPALAPGRMRGKGRITVQYGCCYSYAHPASITDDEVQALPPRLEGAAQRRSTLHAWVPIAPLRPSQLRSGALRSVGLFCPPSLRRSCRLPSIQRSKCAIYSSWLLTFHPRFPSVRSPGGPPGPLGSNPPVLPPGQRHRQHLQRGGLHPAP